MDLEEHCRKLERMYATAPINGFFRPVLQASAGAAEITVEVRRDFFHAAGALHGSVYFKMLDDAAFFAAASRVEDVFVLTVSFNVNLLRPVTAGTIRSRGKVVHESRQLLVAEAEMTDDEGRVVARGSGTFMRSRVSLGPPVGYA